jgi:hypothetical protein
MNRYEVAHRWAKQHVNRRGQCTGKSGSFFYEGPTIYSWGTHWPLATIRTLEDTGERVVLFHDVYYSSSTQRHASEARRAAYGHFPIHRVEHDYWRDVTDRASLDHAVERSKEAARDRAEEKRIARNNQARRNKEHRCTMLRQDLERETGADLDDMPDATVMRVASMCRVDASRRYGWRYRNYEKNTNLLAFLTTLFAEQPELIKDPRKLANILNNYTLLAA